MPKGFTEPEKELIRQRLMEQGMKQFSIYGLRKTNVEEITRAAGISKGSFYLFYESKEALFMDVVEEVEKQYRQELLSLVNLPGDSPRSRLFTILKKSFTLWKTIPILQVFSGSDFNLLMVRIPAKTMKEHAANDQIFLENLITRCRSAGIPIQINANQFRDLSYALLQIFLHEDDFGKGNLNLTDTLNLLLEMVAAHCLGEIELQLQQPIGKISQ